MTRAHGGFAVLAALAAAGVAVVQPPSAGHTPADDPPEMKPADPALEGSAVAAVLKANGGKAPATGAELAKALAKLGKFAQLPVVFSAVRLDSGLGNPRVVITPAITGLSEAGVTETNLNARLFLAANMEKGVNGGDPRVTSVEFISWNTRLQRFDFGVIENMGSDGEPQLRVVDGGRCFSCHKNKGPILGAAPWTNTTHHTGMRTLVEGALKVVPLAPPLAPAAVRDRVDGMALAAPEAAAVDEAVRLGSLIRLNRETFRLMNRSPGGRKGFVAMLVAITEPVELDPNERESKRVVDAWANDPSYLRFRTDWTALTKATNSGILIDFAPIPKPAYESWGPDTIKPIAPPPPGFVPTRLGNSPYEKQVRNLELQNARAAQNIATKLQQIVAADTARAEGKHGMPSAAQPSNPRAFVPPRAASTVLPSGMVNPVMLAGAMGLTKGDRHFLARSLKEAAERADKPKVTAAALARAVFEGPEFADVLAGGPLPDRDEFKDRFVAGLDKVLTTQGAARGFAPERREYASGPGYDPKAAVEEVAAAPTTACLRCHDVRPAGNARLFEPIPALPFDPFDKAARADWVRVADKKRKQEVLARLLERLHTDADMPPQDSPEHDLFRVKGAAAFGEVKDFLGAELDKLRKP